MSLNMQAYNQYKKSNIETTAPEKLITMLYEGLLKNIKQAKRYIESNDINQAHKEIVNGQEILIELMSSLNMDYEISQPLFLLYEYLHHQLVQANVKKDAALLDEVETFVVELRDTWQAAIIKSKSQPPADAEGARSRMNTNNTAAAATPVNNVMPRINVRG